tara:strand:+ start:312 stop:533 length:222 start_codon:yes stop_codon:yes gene_type:complete
MVEVSEVAEKWEAQTAVALVQGAVERAATTEGESAAAAVQRVVGATAEGRMGTARAVTREAGSKSHISIPLLP